MAIRTKIKQRENLLPLTVKLQYLMHLLYVVTFGNNHSIKWKMESTEHVCVRSHLTHIHLLSTCTCHLVEPLQSLSHPVDSIHDYDLKAIGRKIVQHLHANGLDIYYSNRTKNNNFEMFHVCTSVYLRYKFISFEKFLFRIFSLPSKALKRHVTFPDLQFRRTFGG